MEDTRSYRLKLDRATRHLEELKAQVTDYSNVRPYEALRVSQKDIDPNTLVYQARVREQPNPCLALIVGDIVHNIRCSLDHIVNDLVPNKRKGRAQFPIRSDNPWRTDETGRHVFVDSGDRWDDHTNGIPEKALAIIKALQPYHGGEREKLAILSSLENRDKHRRLTVTLLGMRNVSTTLVATDGSAMLSQSFFGDLEDGAIVAAFPFSEKPDPTEMDVHIHGSVHVAVQVPRAQETPLPIPYGLAAILDYVRDNVIVSLEPFIPAS